MSAPLAADGGNTQSDIEVVCFNCKGVLVAPAEMVGQDATCEACRAIVRIPGSVTPPPVPMPVPEAAAARGTPALTLELLKSLEWKRFEEVVAMLFATGGHRTKLARIGADGGVDVHVFKEGDPKPIAVIQCKAWNAYTVGVKPVRELFGVMAADGIAKGYFVTSGDFTSEAREFAAGKTIKLVSGTALVERIAALPDEQKRDLYNAATYGDYTTPTCPSCGRKLVRRISKKGRTPGDEFWGCPGYPRCRYKMRMSRANKDLAQNYDRWAFLRRA